MTRWAGPIAAAPLLERRSSRIALSSVSRVVVVMMAMARAAAAAVGVRGQREDAGPWRSERSPVQTVQSGRVGTGARLPQELCPGGE